MRVIRFIVRFSLFMVGLAASVFIVGAGVIVLRNNAAGTGITLTEAGPSVGRAPADAEDVALYLLLQARADEINAPLSDDPTEVPFTIAAGESALAVAERLAALNLVSDAQLFRQFLLYNQLDVSIEAGD
ncbi:MAG: hypothetical protein ACE5G8_17590, partial [Anaerolineae bacterium]